MKKSLFRIRNTWQAVLAGIIAGIISTAAIVCLLALILVRFDIPSDYVKYLWLAPAIFSGFISGAVTGKYVRSKGFLWGCVSAFCGSLICLSVLLFINSFSVELLTLLIVPVFALAGSTGGIVSANLK